MSDVMRFADIRKEYAYYYCAPKDDPTSRYLMLTLDALAEQERIRESVPVREPEGPTLAEQIQYARNGFRFLNGDRSLPMMRAILATLERVAREADDGR